MAVLNDYFADCQGKRDEAERGQNSARVRWRRAVFLVRRLVDHDLLVASNGVHADSEDVESKELETQHWLELIDRYDEPRDYLTPYECLN